MTLYEIFYRFPRNQIIDIIQIRQLSIDTISNTVSDILPN